MNSKALLAPLQNLSIPRLRIFIAYTESEKALALQLTGLFETAGAKVKGEHKLQGGEDRKVYLKKWLDEAHFIIILLSNDAMSKAGPFHALISWAADTIEEQPDGRVALIPVRVDECQVPRLISRYMPLNGWEDNATHRFAESLKQGVTDRAKSNDWGKANW